MEECLDISRNALHDLKKFHYSNELWFARRVALARKSFGNIEEAIIELDRILTRKKEWFIQRELAELHFQKKDTEKAFTFAMDAVNNHGDLEYKIGLLELIGDILHVMEEGAMACRHFALSKAIRESNGWKVPRELESKVGACSDEISVPSDRNDLVKELEKFWKRFRKTNRSEKVLSDKKLKGKVSRMLHDNERGKDGFLHSDDDRDFYFSIPADHRLSKSVVPKARVDFTIFSTNDGSGRERAKIVSILS
jgi:hypothetical protein